MELYKTSIPKLDEFLDGGIRPKTITVFWATPGIENTPFAYQLMMESLERGDYCVYITQSKKSSTVEKEIEHYGWNATQYRKVGTLKFIDAYSGLINADSADEFYIKDARNPKAITEMLEKALEGIADKNKIVIFDSLSTLIDHCGEESLEELSKWKKLFEKYNAAGVFLFIEWPYDSKVLNKIKLMADAIVCLKAIEEKVILREYFTISKVAWNGKNEGVGIPFKISVPGGVKVYIPKLLVTGPYNAGKSSFVHSASTGAVSVDRLGTTIALDHGHVDYAGFSVDLFGTPGQERFDPILGLLGGEALGVIVVIDSADPDSFVRAKEMMERSKSVGLPCVVAANKANVKGSLSPEDIRKKMRLPKDIPIIPVSADSVPSKEKGKEPAKLNEEDLHNVFDVLFKTLM
ncbi:MAG: GTP-binding protein [Candidatus Altiarchaeales archaeon]|nr:GTP-binding protein [Candidatus Altiarchaeota archaeon]MBU4342268.1 GTP-binding protein [Candidatus Altiarchaeota archaeon]MBU4437230.1 GTP-binding protein [Candidatus Altiarchaeota archaeon]MCG2782460.1 GTP-binding protein [Candidatus Altiarchaeales archaeon]